jgi:hypothetical protein
LLGGFFLPELLVPFDILDPTAEVVRTAIRGAAADQLSWFDAIYGLTEGLSGWIGWGPKTSSKTVCMGAFGWLILS